jgi:PAS domain S-box-containing protein
VAKRIKAAPDDANDRFRLAIEAARVPIWEYDVASDTVRGNIYWHRIFGYDLSEEESSRRTETWLSDVHPDDIRNFSHVFEDGFTDQNGFYEAEFRVRTKNGAHKWILERGRIVARDEGGRPTTLRGIVLDIDARKHVEGVLEESDRHRRAVIDASPVPFALNDQRGNVTLLNDAFVRTFGYSMADIPTLAEWWTRAYPDAAYRSWVEQTWRNRLKSALRTNSAFEPLEVVVRCKDGTERTAIAYAASLGESASGTYLVALLDVSRQRQAEAAALAAVSREQQRIGMDLHDDIGQQLTGLSLMLSALGRSAQAKGNSEISEELTKLSELAGICVASVRAIAHGLAPTQLGGSGIQQLLRSLAESTTSALGLQVNLRFFGFRDLVLEQRICETMFRIAQEALTNVARHAEATKVHIESRIASGIVTLTIKDNGRGLPAQDSPAGLGWGNMRYRASTVGGRVEFMSPQAGGTTIRFSCPLRVADGVLPVRDPRGA